MATRYRLPEQLGGHEVEVTAYKGERVVVEVFGIGADAGQLFIEMAIDDLVEVKPPSITDPVEIPLEIEDDFADACLFMTAEPEPLIRVRVREQHLRDRSSTYVTAEFKPTADGLRQLARAAWLLGTREAS